MLPTFAVVPPVKAIKKVVVLLVLEKRPDPETSLSAEYPVQEPSVVTGPTPATRLKGVAAGLWDARVNTTTRIKVRKLEIFIKDAASPEPFEFCSNGCKRRPVVREHLRAAVSSSAQRPGSRAYC